MNGLLELRIITQPYSEVYWGYFRHLVFGNSLTKHNKLSSFSYSVVIFSFRFPTYRLVKTYHAKPPDFPRLFEPRVTGTNHSSVLYAITPLVHRLGKTSTPLEMVM